MTSNSSLAVILLSLALITSSAIGNEKTGLTSELLKFVPLSTESMLGVNSEFKLKQLTDLNEVTLQDIAVFYTTLISSRHQKELGLTEIEFLCAVNAVKNIRAPALESNIVNGPFDSSRCELLMSANEIVEDRIIEKSKGSGGEVISLAGRKVLKMSLHKQSIFLAVVTKRIICISNDESYLLGVLAIADRTTEHREMAVIDDSVFKTASSLIAKSSSTWGIRLFSRDCKRRDITCLRNVDNVNGFHDSKVMFVVLDIQAYKDGTLLFHYAGADKEASTKRLLKHMDTLVRSSGFRTVNIDKAPYYLTSLDCSLNDHNDDPVSVVFNLFCIAIGQGMML